MTKDKTIQVKGIEQVAQGTKNGKDWKMFKITDSEDIEYKSFEPMNLGAPYQISYTEEPRKPFTNKEGKRIEPKGVDRFIKRAVFADSPPVEVKPQSGTVSQDRSLEAAWRQIDGINDRLQSLEDANNPDF